MKRNLILTYLLSAFFALQAQPGYKKLSRDALETMWAAKDSTGYRNALLKYEKAFELFPDSIDATALYKASVLSGQLYELNKAFQFLNILKEIQQDSYGMPGWRVITGTYAASEYKNLLQDERWETLTKICLEKKQAFYENLRLKEKEFFNVSYQQVDSHLTTEELYSYFRSRNQYLPKEQQNYSISFAINDSAQTSFFIHLPHNYNPGKKYPLLVFLHGAVRNNALVDFQTAQTNLHEWNRFYTKYAEKNEVILVFPKGSRRYNWMTSDDGFFMVPEMIQLIKKAINVDENKVFVSGHSNGATGSFSYLMKQPSLFAGFYGFNTYPKVFTGGTFIENIKNRSFINFSTDEDYYYPPDANDSMGKLMKSIDADYEEYRFNGFPHWLPQFDESEIGYQILFKDLMKRNRNPYPEEISWETDDEEYGHVDWLGAIKIDTLAEKRPWHQLLNFKILTWLSYKNSDSLVAEQVNRNAFDYPRKSGKIKAAYSENVFRVETSCIRSFRIYLSPEMVNMKKKIKIYLNDKLVFDKKMRYDKSFLISKATENYDREQIWVNYINLTP